MSARLAALLPTPIRRRSRCVPPRDLLPSAAPLAATWLLESSSAAPRASANVPATHRPADPLPIAHSLRRPSPAPAATTPRSPPSTSPPLPSSANNSSPCACSRSPGPLSRRSPASPIGSASSPAPASPLARISPRTPPNVPVETGSRSMIGKIPAPSTRNVTSSSGFLAIFRDLNTPLV